MQIKKNGFDRLNNLIINCLYNIFLLMMILLCENIKNVSSHNDGMNVNETLLQKSCYF